MTRRSFMINLLAWIKMIALASLFPGVFLRVAGASERRKSLDAEAKVWAYRVINLT